MPVCNRLGVANVMWRKTLRRSEIMGDSVRCLVEPNANNAYLSVGVVSMAKPAMAGGGERQTLPTGRTLSSGKIENVVNDERGRIIAPNKLLLA